MKFGVKPCSSIILRHVVLVLLKPVLMWWYYVILKQEMVLCVLIAEYYVLPFVGNSYHMILYQGTMMREEGRSLPR